MLKLNKFISLVVKVFVFSMLLVFFISNGKMIDINLVFLTISISIQLFFVIILVFGILIGYLLGAKHRKLTIKTKETKLVKK